MVYEHGHMYKGVRVNSFGIPLFLLGGDIDSDIRIKKENRKNCFYNKTFVSPFKKSSTKNLIKFESACSLVSFNPASFLACIYFS